MTPCPGTARHEGWNFSTSLAKLSRLEILHEAANDGVRAWFRSAASLHALAYGGAVKS